MNSRRLMAPPPTPPAAEVPAEKVQNRGAIKFWQASPVEILCFEDLSQPPAGTATAKLHFTDPERRLGNTCDRRIGAPQHKHLISRFQYLIWSTDASLCEIAALRHRMDKGSTSMLLSHLLHLFRGWRRYDASVQ